ncbi:hypothetical protein A0H81_11276 [Grifola frondosa]|uniref:F-box domain-containing protein n=1 Tax=Grifola frondosa TaxID=5627 RepID=A0A1C7LX01_GRIFR|nr:hypothetical protein A0H81_11276 [Grifola frondosa]
MSLVLGPALTDLDLSGITSIYYFKTSGDNLTPSLVAFLSRAKVASPCLKKVHLSSGRLSPQLRDTISNLVCALRILEHFVYTVDFPLTEDALGALAQSNHLRNLGLHLPENDGLLLPLKHITNPFASLRSLILHVDHLQSYLTFSGLATLPLVESFNLQIKQLPPQTLVEQLFADLSFRLSSEHLTQLVISSPADIPLTSDVTIHSPDLRPLLVFRLLQHAEITPRWKFDLDDELMREIASS